MARIRKQVTCNCEAYHFPHRIDSKACRELYNEKQEAQHYESDSLQSLGLVAEFDISKQIYFYAGR